MSARVLVVEDHILVAIGLQLALSARGWEVKTTDGPTAAEIIEQAEAFQPQCVLLDIRLGDVVGSGIELIEPLRATGAKVVMLTAETRWPVLAACLEQGAAGWIGKDTFLDNVEAALDDVLTGTPLIGCGARDAMLEELRIERAGLHRALSPFERLTARERDVLAALVDGLSAEKSPRPSSP
jgi:DNA-binding NarL/FixJ family response regulator